MNEVRKTVTLDYYEHEKLKRYYNLIDKLNNIMKDNEGCLIEYTADRYFCNELNFIIKTKGIREICDDYEEKLKLSSDYIDELKTKVDELKNRKLIQRILNK